MTHKAGHHLPAEIDQCIRDCTDCHRVCLSTVSHCLEMGGEHAEQRHVTMMLDCAEVCMSAGAFMIRRSEFAAAHCSLCADICLRCAEDCERFSDDQMMQECAEVCRRCAESCTRMAAAGAA